MFTCEKDIMKGEEGKLRGELKATRDGAKDLEHHLGEASADIAALEEAEGRLDLSP